MEFEADTYDGVYLCAKASKNTRHYAGMTLCFGGVQKLLHRTPKRMLIEVSAREFDDATKLFLQATTLHRADSLGNIQFPHVTCLDFRAIRILLDLNRELAQRSVISWELSNRALPFWVRFTLSKEEVQ